MPPPTFCHTQFYTLPLKIKNMQNLQALWHSGPIADLDSSGRVGRPTSLWLPASSASSESARTCSKDQLEASGEKLGVLNEIFKIPGIELAYFFSKNTFFDGWNKGK